LFFQCALIALVFAVLSTLANQQIKIIFFIGTFFVFYLTAHSLNNFVEAEDVLFLRRRQLQLNNAARLMGLKKRAAQAGK